MKISVLAVGHRMPVWVAAGFDEYARRMPGDIPLRLREIKPAPRGSGASGDVIRWLGVEAARLNDAVPAGALRVVLDERGQSFPTRKLAGHLGRWRDEGRELAFVIGGADGLAQEIKDRADLLWSLSPLTLPHGLVRVILAEQIYRAVSILFNHPYHRE